MKYILNIPASIPKKYAITYARIEEAGLLDNEWQVKFDESGIAKIKTRRISEYYFVVPEDWIDEIIEPMTFQEWYNETYTEFNKDMLKASVAEAYKIWNAAIENYKLKEK